MPLKIRLARHGAKKKPFYRIVVADSRAPRNGRFIEKVGHYNPLLSSDDNERIVLNAERIAYWIKNGALPTERVEKFLVNANIIELSKKKAALNEDRKKRAEEIKHKADADAVSANAA
ncbi:MAG: 30S ribosomal protein S16 [Rickettsiales bacterium]